MKPLVVAVLVVASVVWSGRTVAEEIRLTREAAQRAAMVAIMIEAVRVEAQLRR